MATSTERTVRDLLVATIRGIAQSDLGFDEVGGNVREYPLEMHQEERVSEYLAAKVGNKNVMRAWAVDVRGSETPYALYRIPIRTYSIQVIGYYAKTVDGDAYLDMLDHARKIRGAINALSCNLSNTVSRITSTSELRPVNQSGTQAGKLFVGAMTYSAQKTNPDF